ncbi:MAG: cystathionine beta-lyase [Desulfobacteraceae bacterium]|jgi:cystathionine beta-lyase|nr:cystathionine beta-lyase [Desulfobacteraceae bacterium]
MNESTKLINVAACPAAIGGKPLKTVNPPVYRGSTVLFECCEDMHRAQAGHYDGVTYGTDRLPTQRSFEEALRDIEDGHLTRAFQSGISAITHTLMAFTRAGDHILVCENVYGPTARFCDRILSKFNIQATYVPSAVGADIAGFIRPETRLIFLESPGSNTFEIQDIPAIAEIARKKDIVTVIDNTWATPLYLKPFALGVDMSIQSVTKYISGHSDVLLGAVTVNQRCAEQLAKYYKTLEIFASPNDCYLALRGLKTLPVRLQRHEQSALQVAQWLQTLDAVAEVMHPALPSHPQHHLWQRDFSGSSGLFAFTFMEDWSPARIAAFVDALDLFGIGFSWGGFKSLITAGHYRRPAGSRYAGKTVIRLNIGLEDPEDLIADLQKGIAAGAAAGQSSSS